jgi:uncharacterized protein YdhG (YjbR/CyaY superfamily)
MNKKDEVVHYLNSLPTEEKKTLSEIRGQILQLIPSIEERLCRSVPFFYYKGKRVVGFRSTKTHLSFFIMEGNVLKDLRNELEKYNLSSTVVRFSVEKPLTKSIIKRLVLTRIEEIEKSGR